jgi:ATP-dependent helicase/nuclease subunit B
MSRERGWLNRWRIMSEGSELLSLRMHSRDAIGRGDCVLKTYQYGRLGSDLRTGLVQRCIDQADQGRRSLYLAPSREVIFAVRDQIEALQGGIMHIQVGGLEDLEKCLLPSGAVCRIDGQTAVRMVQYILKQIRAGKAHEVISTAADQEGLARLLYRQIKRTKRANLDPDQLTERLASAAIPQEKEPFWELLADVYRVYQTMLNDRGLLDVDDLSMLAARSEAAHPALLPDFLVLDGYINVDPVHRDMLAKLFTLHPQLGCMVGVPFFTKAADSFLTEEIISDLEGLGFQCCSGQIMDPAEARAAGELAEALFTLDPPRLDHSAQIHFLDAPCRADEVRQVLHRVRALLRDQAVPPHHIALVVRDLIHYQVDLAEVAEEMAVPLQMTLMKPLSSSHLMKDVLRILARLSHVPNSDLFSEAALIHYTAEAEGALGWLETCWPEEAELAAYWQCLRNWLDKACLGHLVMTLYEAGEISLEWLHGELAALQLLAQMLTEMEFSNTLLGDTTLMSAEDFYLLLARELDERFVPGAQPAGGVRVLDPDLLRGVSWDHVFCLGLNDGVFPRTGEQDLFAIAQMPSQDSLPAASFAWELEREKIRFASVCIAAKCSLTLSYRTANEDGSYLLPSAFLQDAAHLLDHKLKAKRSMRDRFYPRHVEVMSVQELLRSWAVAGACMDSQTDVLFEPLLERDGVLSRRLAQIRRGAWVEAQRFSQDPADQYDGNLQGLSLPQQAAQYSFSASQLNTYRLCPFRYYANRILGLGRQEDEDEITPLFLGNLYHRILAEYYRREPEALELQTATLNICLQEAMEGLLQFNYSPLFLLAKDQEIRDHLTAFLEEDLRIRKDFRSATGAELRPKFLEWKVVDETAIPGCPLQANLDRVDLEYRDGEPTGRFMVYDYKLKTIKTLRDILKGEDLQLPVYVLLSERAVASELRMPDVQCMGALFLSITKLERKGIYRDGWKKALGFHGRGIHDDQWDVLMAGFRNRIASLTERIRDGDFCLPRHCPLQGSFAPFRCDYTNMCRYHSERMANKGGDVDGKGILCQ